MHHVQLIYSSQPFGFDEAILNGILLDARRCNNRDGITGALVCRRDIYLQLLEGPDAEVQSAFDRIIRDDRHVNIQKLLCRPVTDRLFAAWDMFRDPAQSCHWTGEQISEGVLDNANEDEVLNVFIELANRLDEK